MNKGPRGVLRKRASLFWLTLLLCCAALAAGQRMLDRQKRHAEAVERDFQGRLDEVCRAIIPYRDRSTAQVAAGLNGGRPLGGTAGEEARPMATLAGTMFDDRAALAPGVSPLSPAASFRAERPGGVIGPRLNGWVIHLHFVDDRLAGAYAITPPHAPFIGPSAAWLTMQLALPGLAYLGAGVWCLSLLILPFNRRWGRPIAHAALAGLLVAALAQLLGHGWSLPPLSLSGALHAPLLTAVVAAALFSLIGIMIPLRRARAPDGTPPCAHCGYDLTGNISGICPECGRYTPPGLIDRWREEAERIAHIEDANALETYGDTAIDQQEDEADPEQDGELEKAAPPVLAPLVCGPEGTRDPNLSVHEDLELLIEASV